MRRLVMQCNNLINTRRILQNKYARQLDVKAEKIATNELDQKFIEQATRVVEENMENPEFCVEIFSDIAYRLGFGNPQYFNKCFKELFSIAPTQYRKSQNPPSQDSET